MGGLALLVELAVRRAGAGRWCHEPDRLTTTTSAGFSIRSALLGAGLRVDTRTAGNVHYVREKW